jgi:hypothetical protein
MVARLELDAPPTVSFGGGPGCLAGATNETFTASASDPEEAVTAIDWDLSGNGQFADAHGATVTVPASAITAPGGKISVRATDADGITAVATHAPEVPPCAPLASSFGGVALVGSRLTMDAHGNVTLHVSSAVPASGQITLTSGPVKVTSGHGKHRRTIRKRVQLAKVSFKLASSGQTTLRVKLTTAGQALVRKLRKLGITVTIRGLGAGRSVTTIAKATIAAPKAKRKRKR